jgi:hypothetical protein
LEGVFGLVEDTLSVVVSSTMFSAVVSARPAVRSARQPFGATALHVDATDRV